METHASKGWPGNFRKTLGLEGIKGTGEAVSADGFPDAKRATEEEKQLPEQLLRAEEGALVWENAKRTFTSKEAK